MVLFNKIIFFFLLGAASLQAASLFSGLPSHDQNTWRRLLHFEGESSTIDEPSFFVDPIGSQDEDAELKTFIELLKDPNFKSKGQLPQRLPCAYPARIEFLEKTGLIKKSKNYCPDFELWQKEVDPESLSIVFSTAYPNNPGSMFGHTFLKFGKKDQKNDLLNYGANYSALTNENDIGIVYAFKGIFGGYRGFFDLAPYYLKVNEYNHAENRDLIEYQLNLGPEKVQFLLKHLWELYHGASFDYYFTGENCSYHLAKLIDIVLERPLAMPRSWYYLPADLIHALYNDRKLVVKVTDRSSKMREVIKSLERVEDHKEVKYFYKKGRISGNQLRNLSYEEMKALVELLNLEKFKEKEKFAKNKMLLRILFHMAKIKNSPKKESIKASPFRNRPHLAHPSQKIALGAGAFENRGTLNLQYQGGYHDLLTKDDGLQAFSDFRFLTGQGYYLFEDQKLRLENFTFIKVSSLHPWRWFSNQLSWQAGAWIEDILENPNCRNCYRGVLQGKLGLSFGGDFWMTSFLFGGREEVSSRLREKFNQFVVYEIISGVTIKEKLKLLFSWEGRHNIAHVKERMNSRLDIGVNYSWSRLWETRATMRQAFLGKSFNSGAKQFSLLMGFYF